MVKQSVPFVLKVAGQTVTLQLDGTFQPPAERANEQMTRKQASVIAQNVGVYFRSECFEGTRPFGISRMSAWKMIASLVASGREAGQISDESLRQIVRDALREGIIAKCKAAGCLNEQVTDEVSAKHKQTEIERKAQAQVTHRNGPVEVKAARVQASTLSAKQVAKGMRPGPTAGTAIDKNGRIRDLSTGRVMGGVPGQTHNLQPKVVEAPVAQPTTTTAPTLFDTPAPAVTSKATNGTHVQAEPSIADLLARFARLEQENQALKAQVEALSMPVEPVTTRWIPFASLPK